jgi:predicted GNAT family N-acyltransferase
MRSPARELQAIYMARQKVFAIEQNCASLDVDGLDERAFHLAAGRRCNASPRPTLGCSSRARSTPRRRSGASSPSASAAVVASAGC